MVSEITGLRVIHGKADEVGRQYVRRELHAPVIKAHRAAERHGQCGLAHARLVVEQDMPVREQREQDLFDHFPLSRDDFFDFRYDPFQFPVHVVLLMIRNSKSSGLAVKGWPAAGDRPGRPVRSAVFSTFCNRCGDYLTVMRPWASA